MSRVLNRPMFRLGGSTSGITSGLDTPKRGRVDGPGSYQGMTDEDLARYAASSQKVADKFFPQQRPDINRFLIDWGLNMVGNPPSGNVLQTAARQAQGPTKELFESIDRSKGMRAATGADIFGKMIEAEGEMRGGEAGAKWQKQWALNKVKDAYNGMMDNNIKLEELREDPAGNKDLILELERENKNFEIDIAQLQEDNPLVRSISSNKQIIENIYNSTIDKLADIDIEVTITEENKNLYPQNEVGEVVFKKKWDEDSPEIQAEAIRQIQIMFGGPNIDLSFLEKTAKKAEGGRIGYQGGELVEDVSMQETIQPEPGTPEVDPVGMSFEELRARLPATITDDIVILLSQSGQALEDFATIQTQQDVDNFNTKYNVNLVLPSEG